MFRCDKCGEVSGPKERQNKVTISREKVYEEFNYEYDPKTRKRTKIPYESHGTEISVELSYCKHCYGKLGEKSDGSKNAQRKGRTDNGSKGRDSQIEKRSEIDRGRSQRVG